MTILHKQLGLMPTVIVRHVTPMQTVSRLQLFILYHFMQMLPVIQVAQVELAEMYYLGHGVQRDKTKARMLIAEAAANHYPRAQLDNLQMRIEAGNVTSQEMMDALGSVLRASTTPPSGR